MYRHEMIYQGFTLGVFYRPPYNDLKPLEDLYSALQNLSTPELVLLGDFNLREFDWVNNNPLNSSDLYVKFTEIMHENFFLKSWTNQLGRRTFFTSF